MAKIIYGSLAGSLSGHIGNTVFSHNRYGAYIRVRTIPTKRTTLYTAMIRGLVSSVSKAWAGLDVAERAAWETWAGEHPVIDKLGQSQVLQGSSAFNSINLRIALVKAMAGTGGVQLDIPPLLPSPAAVSGLTLTVTEPATASLAFTSGALPAGVHMMIWAAVVNAPGRLYYANLLKLVKISAAAATTPQALGTELVARFGALAAGQRVYVHAQTIDSVTGLVSGIAIESTTVVAP